MEAQHTMPDFPWWQAPVRAFFDRQFYVDVARNWKGLCILYMFLLCLIATVIGVIPIAVAFSQGAKNESLSNLLDQLPRITLESGRLSIDKPYPYRMHDAKSGAVIAEFRDADGLPTLTESDPGIVITHDYLAMQGGDPKQQPFHFADLKSMDKFSFDGADVKHVIEAVCFWAPIVILVIGVPMIFIGHLMQMLVYGLIATIICNAMERPIPYSAGMRLAAMAITPNIILSSLFALATLAFGIPEPVSQALRFGWVLASIVIAMIYLVVAANALKQAPAPELAAG